MVAVSRLPKLVATNVLFPVGENGAVWVQDDTLRHRVIYIIPQRIALAVPASRIVSNIQEAYSKIDAGRHRFAGFISGPSRTTDIEQSLVIGAHGARSLTVSLIDELHETEGVG